MEEKQSRTQENSYQEQEIIIYDLQISYSKDLANIRLFQTCLSADSEIIISRHQLPLLIELLQAIKKELE